MSSGFRRVRSDRCCLAVRSPQVLQGLISTRSGRGFLGTPTHGRARLVSGSQKLGLVIETLILAKWKPISRCKTRIGRSGPAISSQVPGTASAAPKDSFAFCTEHPLNSSSRVQGPRIEEGRFVYLGIDPYAPNVHRLSCSGRSPASLAT
jgi:hypothetical protein